MKVKLITAIALVASTLVASTAAEAGNNYQGGHKYERKHNDDWRYRNNHRGYFRIYVGDYGDACDYYRYKARRTHSRYWWRKYERCIVRY